MLKKFPYITRPILILSVVSLCTDMASEMLYPVMPAFLQSIGFSVLFIGILEGFAEMIAGLSKGYFGKRSDVLQKRLPFVQLGYALSAISKPMMALWATPVWIFMARTTDRIGKGLRSAPRDAMLSAMTTPAYKARVFGFHRSMDTLGAVFGPLIALLVLWIYPGQYTILFLIAFIPGLIAVISTFMVSETPGAPRNEKVHLFSFIGYIKEAPATYKKLLAGLVIFALINSSDVLLLLRMKEQGVEDHTIITMYIVYNIIFALTAFPLGILADKIGIRNMLVIGLIVFAVVYAGFAAEPATMFYWLLFGLYGIYAAATEGIAKSWITNISPKKDAGAAVGAYSGLASMAAFAASTLAGALWAGFGAAVAFGVSATVAIGVAIYLMRVPYRIHADA